MEEILLHPILWIVIAVILISVTVASFIISGKRSKEVKELDKMFPEGKLASKNLDKIPVEKVRRHSMERERRKKEREKILPKRIRPKEGEKVFAEEDQEFILRSPQKRSSTNEEKRPPLRPRAKVSDSIKQNTNPSLNQEKINPSQAFAKQEETNTHTHQNTQSFTTRLKPSDQINETESSQDQMISSELKPFSKPNRSTQSKRPQSTYAKRPFTQRTQSNTQNQADQQEGASGETKQPFKSRSSKYSVKKRLF